MKKPAGVPGDSGAVRSASVGHSPSSDEMVRGIRSPEGFSIEAGVAVAVDVGFWGLGAQNLLMHVSQTRLGGVYARRTCGCVVGWEREGGGVECSLGEKNTSQREGNRAHTPTIPYRVVWHVRLRLLVVRFNLYDYSARVLVSCARF